MDGEEATQATPFVNDVLLTGRISTKHPLRAAEVIKSETIDALAFLFQSSRGEIFDGDGQNLQARSSISRLPPKRIRGGLKAILKA